MLHLKINAINVETRDITQSYALIHIRGGVCICKIKPSAITVSNMDTIRISALNLLSDD